MNSPSPPPSFSGEEVKMNATGSLSAPWGERVGVRWGCSIAGLLPPSSRPDLAEEDEKRLSDYAVAIRYPGEAEHVSLNEAEEALGLARRVRTHFRRKLAEEGA